MSKRPLKKIILGTMEMGRRMNFEESIKMLEKFQNYGYTELDTAYMYSSGGFGGKSGGLTEEFLGRMDKVKGQNLATKANPGEGMTLSPKSIRHQLETSLKKMDTNCIDIFYLHWPCMDVPISETLKEVDNLYKEGKFERFGLSNFISWQVAEVNQICLSNNFVKPVVYQGMYNCLTRMVETELLPCIRKYGMSFYSFNPLAGGILTGKHKRDDIPQTDTHPGRFAGEQLGQNYRDRFWRPPYFDALDIINEACLNQEVSISSAALRWIKYHSALSCEHNDALIVGSSNINHLVSNMDALNEGPLPLPVFKAIEAAFMGTKGHGPSYFRNVTEKHSAQYR